MQFALTGTGQTLADWAFAMYRDKFLRACSVGFVPVKMVSKWDGDKTGFLEQVSALKLDAQTAAKLSCVYISQEQIELSGCIIGANPSALAKSLSTVAAAYKAGTLSEESVTKLSALIANSKTAPSTADSVDVERASPRTKLALLAEIQKYL